MDTVTKLQSSTYPSCQRQHVIHGESVYGRPDHDGVEVMRWL